MLAQTILSSRSDTQYLSQPPSASISVSQRGIPGLSASLPLACSPSTTANYGTIDQQNPMLRRAPEPVNTPEQVIPVKHPAISSVHEMVSNDSSKPVTPVDDEEDFYSPEPADILPVADQSEPASRSTALVRSPSEEGEMAMSESDEEEYEPEEPQEPLTHAQASNDPVLEQSTTVVTAQASSSGSPLVSPPAKEDEDPYEPPDVDQPMMDLESGGTTTAPKTNAQQGEVEEEEMDMSTSSDENSGSDTSSESLEEEPTGPALALSRKNLGSSVTVADDLVPELQPDASAGASVSQEIVMPPVKQESVSHDAPLHTRLTMRRL
jgi:hypothetical protein